MWMFLEAPRRRASEPSKKAKRFDDLVRIGATGKPTGGFEPINTGAVLSIKIDLFALSVPACP